MDAHRDVAAAGGAGEACVPFEPAFPGDPALTRALVDSPVHGVLVHRDFKPLFANQTLARMLDLPSVSELLALDSLAEMVHPDDRTWVAAYHRARLDGVVSPGRCDLHMLTAQGRSLWLVGTVNVVQWAGQAATLSILIDVTDHKRREHELQQAKMAAELALCAKTRFLAAASHDLRQPVQALSLFLQALNGRPQGAFNAKILSHMRQSVDSLSDLLNSLLDLSKIDAGIVDVAPRDCDLGHILSAVYADCSGAAAAKNLALRVAPTSLRIHSDPVLLGRILRNFTANAVRYTPKGRVLLGGKRAGDVVRIGVWDTGIGIPEDQLSAIFADFHQIGDAKRETEEGLGLGLAIADRMARILGHAIGVRSTYGKGSLFWVEVPLAALAPPSQRQAAGRQQQ